MYFIYPTFLFLCHFPPKINKPSHFPPLSNIKKHFVSTPKMSTQPTSAGKGKSAKTAKGGAAKRHRKQSSNTAKLGGPAIRRLARRAGATRVGKGCFPEVHHIVVTYLTYILEASKSYCLHGKRKTINCQDVLYGMRRVGVRYMGHPFSK